MVKNVAWTMMEGFIKNKFNKNIHRCSSNILKFWWRFIEIEMF